MKKISLLLMGLLALSSCEQEELGDFVESGASQVQTRAASSIADFDPISELDGLLLNIKPMGSITRYLSCVKSGTKVDLFGKDDDSGRQQWLIRSGKSIVLPRGNDANSSNYYLVAAADNWNSLVGTSKIPSTIKLYPILRNDSPLGISMLPGFGFKYLSNNNCLIFVAHGGFPPTYYYLKAESQTSSALQFSTDNSTALSQWKICPKGLYELVDLEYVKTAEDNFVPIQILADRDQYTNESLSVQTWHYSVNTSVIESSNYSDSQGVSYSLSQSTTVGAPNLSGDGGNVTENTTIQQQLSRTWNFGKNDGRTDSKTRTGDIPVQPGETIRLEAMLTRYKGTLTYVATLRKIGETKTFRVKGKWEGECFSNFVANTYSSATGKFLKAYDLK